MRHQTQRGLYDPHTRSIGATPSTIVFAEAIFDPCRTLVEFSRAKIEGLSMIRLSNLTDRFGTAGSLLLAALPLLALGALAH
jgi:hypothetical protein